MTEVKRKKQANEYMKAWQSKPENKAKLAAIRATPEYKRKQKKRNLKRIYGITIEQYEDKLQAQDNCCAVCNHPFGEALVYVDHDHNTGRVRDLLCLNCNTLLGKAKDDVQILESAVTYLNRWRNV